MITLIRMLPVLFALGCFIAGIFVRKGSRRGIRHPVYTQAVVVSKVSQTGYRHHAIVEQSAPVVRYRTESGEITSTCRNYVPEWQYTYRIGEQISICYDKENQTLFRICRNQGNIWYSSLLLVTGAGTLLAYAALLLQYY